MDSQQLLALYPHALHFTEKDTGSEAHWLVQGCKASRWCRVDPKSRWNISIKIELPFRTDDILVVLNKHMANGFSFETCTWIIFKCVPELLASSTRSELLGNSSSTLHFHTETTDTQSNKSTGNRTRLSKVSLSAGGGGAIPRTGCSREGGHGGWLGGQPFGGGG